MKKQLISIGLIVFLAACQSQISNPSSTIKGINGLQKANIELAITDEQHQIGLMNRPQLAADNGMLFVFEQTAKPCFWMKNTLIPLTVGFIDEHGVLLQTMDMQAQTLDAHCPNLPYRYALEMNQGWFARQNISIGTQILNTP